ncbi:MAG: hypothetical protein NTU62_00325 [Spirochaetes bacterium]|nr:hypothetical protein [Spirochaetota bacterium]
MRTRVLAVLVTLLATFAAAVLPYRAGAEPKIYDGAWNWEHPNELRVTEDEMFPNTPYERDWQSHSYYWMGRLDTGHVVVIGPFQWRYGAIGAWGMYVIVRDPRGRVFTWDGKIGDGSLEVAPSGMRISAGKIRFESRGGVHRWTVDVPGFSCDFTFTNVLPAWKPGSGVARFDSEHYTTYSLPAPWADLSGTMTVNGETVDAAGQCMFDTSETLLPLTRANAEIQAARVWSPPGTPRADRWFIGTLTTVSHPGYGSLKLPMLLVAHGDRWVFTTMDYTIAFSEMMALADPPYPYPARIAVSAHDLGGTMEGVFTIDPPYWITDVFQRLPKMFRTIASWFVKRPVIYRNQARFEGTVTSPGGGATRLELSGQAEFMFTR